MNLPTSSSSIVRFGIFEADLLSGELRRNGVKVRLQDLPFRALRLFLSRPNEVISREELRQALWPEGLFLDFDHGISAAINRLRSTLGDSAANPRFIETMDRRGYRWIAPAQSQTLGAEWVVGSPPDPREGSAPSQEALVSKNTIAASSSQRSRLGVVLAAAGTLCLAILALALLSPNMRNHLSNVRAIAVLPLANLSGDSSQDYLADGMTDELTTELAPFSGLRVVSHTSVQQYKNTNKPLPVIAKELNVDAVVEGSVKREGDRLRVTVQLVDARNDRHIWADTLERSMGSAASLQHQLAEEIANQIGIQLTPLEKQHFAGRHQIDPDSFQAYLQGRYYWNKRTYEGLGKAEMYFQEAIARDPKNALAYAGLADTFLLDSFYTGMPSTEAYKKARDAATQAIALEETLAEAHCSVAYVLFVQDWNFTGAEKEFQRALALNPNYATAHQWYAEMLSVMSRHEQAIAEIRRAEELDPFSMIIHHEAGQLLQNARQYPQALEEYRKAEAIDSNFPWPHYAAAIAYRRQGEYSFALEELAAAASISPVVMDPSAVDAIARAYSKFGRQGFLRQSIVAYSQYPHPAYMIGLAYAALGDKEHAFQYLDQAFRSHNLDILSLQCSPELDGLRADSRYRDLRKRIGLP